MKQVEVCINKKSYGKIVILKNINLILSSNYIYFLTQENGFGKTTFLSCLIQMTRFDGSIKDKYHTVYLPEKPPIPRLCKVKSFFSLFIKSEEQRNLFNLLIEKFNIIKYTNYKFYQLSKGTKQKFMLIKTIIEEADVYYFDEPLEGLDLNSRKIFSECIRYLYEKESIVVISSHYAEGYDVPFKRFVSL